VLLELVVASERKPIIIATLTINRFQTLVCGLSCAIPMSIGTDTPAKGLYEDALQDCNVGNPICRCMRSFDFFCVSSLCSSRRDSYECSS